MKVFLNKEGNCETMPVRNEIITKKTFYLRQCLISSICGFLCGNNVSDKSEKRELDAQIPWI